MSEIPSIEIIFGGVTAIGVIYAILQGVSSNAKDRDVAFTNMLADFEKDLQKILEEENNLITETPDLDKCDRMASDYLNVLDRLAFLREKNKVDDDLIFYFDQHFAYGKTLLQWKVKMFGEKSLLKWPHQIWWTGVSFNKDRIITYSLEFLPPHMKILYNGKEGRDVIPIT